MSKDYFDNIAGEWDEFRKSLFPDNLREKAMQAAGVKAGQRAADIGAGTGFVTEALLKAGLHVVAVDQSEAMLMEIQKKFPGYPLELALGDAQRLALPDNDVDCVFANMFLHHVENPAEAILEMARILKPGGTLVITDMDEHDYAFLLTEQHDRWPGFKRKDLLQWFAAAGLIEIAANCAGDSCCSTSACGCNAEISVFIAYGKKP